MPDDPKPLAERRIWEFQALRDVLVIAGLFAVLWLGARLSFITAPLLASSIRLDLPRTDAAKPSESPKFVTVTLDKAGSTFLDERPVTPGELAERLAEAARRDPEMEVQLRADQAVPYGRVIEVMGAAQKAGLNRVGFVADPGQAE